MPSFSRKITTVALLTVVALALSCVGSTAATTDKIDSPQRASSAVKHLRVAQGWTNRANTATKNVPQRRGTVGSVEHFSVKGTINGGGDFVKNKSKNCKNSRTC